MPRSGYNRRPTQNNPMVEIDQQLFARVTIAAAECKMTPEQWYELLTIEGLKAHGQRKRDAEFADLCRQKEKRLEATPQRWEFDKNHPGSLTDPPTDWKMRP